MSHKLDLVSDSVREILVKEIDAWREKGFSVNQAAKQANKMPDLVDLTLHQIVSQYNNHSRRIKDKKAKKKATQDAILNRKPAPVEEAVTEKPVLKAAPVKEIPKQPVVVTLQGSSNFTIEQKDGNIIIHTDCKTVSISS